MWQVLQWHVRQAIQCDKPFSAARKLCARRHKAARPHPHLRLPDAECAARLRGQQVATAGGPAQQARRLGARLGWGAAGEIW